MHQDNFFPDLTAKEEHKRLVRRPRELDTSGPLCMNDGQVPGDAGPVMQPLTHKGGLERPLIITANRLLLEKLGKGRSGLSLMYGSSTLCTILSKHALPGSGC